MQNLGSRALGEAAQSGGALARGFAALAYPKCLLIMFASAVLAVLLGIGLWYLLHWALFDRQLFAWGWANWLLRQFGAVTMFFLVLLLVPALLGTVVSCFFDAIINEVERRNYPGLPPVRSQSPGELIAYIAKFTILILAVNILALPLYLLLPGVNFLIAWVVNGYIFGREYYESVAMRRLTPRAMHALRNEAGGKVFRAGFLLAVLKTVPFLNLAMPVVGCAYLTHMFHAMPWREKA
ncbi:MAG: EI24 domain-containing protein [Rhodospirillaceae bacterium]|nr:EI24 domain-containing protein [Rhodospirillaceae bacterium]